MNMKLNRVIAALMLLLCLPLLALPAQALSAKITVPVTVKVSGNVRGDTYTVKLTPVDPTHPMPAGTEDGIYTMTFRGKGTQEFSISYTDMGYYDYKLAQAPVAKCDYDKTVYTLRVTVTNKGAQVAMRAEGEGEKLEEAVFENKYKVENRPDTPKTNDESNFPLYIAMAAASILTLAGLYVTRREEEE